MQPNTIHHCDYLELLRSIPDASVDMVLTDPPYNQTKLHYDKAIIDYPAFFMECWRILKDKTRAVVMTAAGKLEYTLKYEMDGRGYRYEWIWAKSMATGFINCNVRPMTNHEHILVFGQSATITGAHKTTLRYFPQMGKGDAYGKINRKANRASHIGAVGPNMTVNTGQRYPTSTLYFPSNNTYSLHPNQKPLDLWGHLIKTYTLLGETIVDPFAGCGTTAVACIQTDRQYIVGDSHLPYVELMRERVAAPIQRELLA